MLGLQQSGDDAAAVVEGVDGVEEQAGSDSDSGSGCARSCSSSRSRSLERLRASVGGGPGNALTGARRTDPDSAGSCWNERGTSHDLVQRLESSLGSYHHVVGGSPWGMSLVRNRCRSGSGSCPCAAASPGSGRRRFAASREPTVRRCLWICSD